MSGFFVAVQIVTMVGGSVGGNVLMWRVQSVLSSIWQTITGLLGFLFASGGLVNLRDYALMRKMFLTFGIDAYPDFEFVMVVHEASYDYSRGRFATKVRVRSGNHVVETDPSETASFQQPFSICVEQGVDIVRVELLDAGRRKVVAFLDLDVMEDIMGSRTDPVRGKLYTMSQKAKVITNPRIRLSLEVEQPDDKVGTLPFNEADVENAVDSKLKKQIEAVRGSVQRCEGGRTHKVFIAAFHQKKGYLGVWKDADAFADGDQFESKIDLLKVRKVEATPQSDNKFDIKYVEGSNQERMTLACADARERDNYSKSMISLITALREMA